MERYTTTEDVDTLIEGFTSRLNAAMTDGQSEGD
jgi:hypothetical protein